MDKVIITPEPKPYDIQEDYTIPVSVRAGIAYTNYKRAVSMAKKAGALK